MLFRSPEYFKNYINDFFKRKSNFDSLWDRNWDRCPSLQIFIRQFKSNCQRLSDPIGRHAKVKHNLTKEERILLMKLRKHDIGYNASDKNYGPVLYLREKYTEQCKLHLFDGKGTYEKISQTKAEVLQNLLQRIKTLIQPMRKQHPALQRLAYTIQTWAEYAVKANVLCKFYIIWKLHKKKIGRAHV